MVHEMATRHTVRGWLIHGTPFRRDFGSVRYENMWLDCRRVRFSPQWSCNNTHGFHNDGLCSSSVILVLECVAAVMLDHG